MAQTNYYIGRTTNSAGESEINLRLYISRDVRLRIGSGIWIDRKRWGKKNDINIPLIQGEEREQLLGKRSRLKALTDLLEQEIKVHPTFRVMRQSCRAYSLRVKYRSSLNPYALRFITFILLLIPSTFPVET